MSDVEIARITSRQAILVALISALGGIGSTFLGKAVLEHEQQKKEKQVVAIEPKAKVQEVISVDTQLDQTWAIEKSKYEKEISALKTEIQDQKNKLESQKDKIIDLEFEKSLALNSPPKILIKRFSWEFSDEKCKSKAKAALKNIDAETETYKIYVKGEIENIGIRVICAEPDYLVVISGPESISDDTLIQYKDSIFEDM